MKQSSYFIFLYLLGTVSMPGQCALLNLPQTPIALTTTVPANVFILLDDSGSMDWEYLGKVAWEGCAYDPNFTGIFSLNTVCGSSWSGDSGLPSYANGLFLWFNYIYSNSDNVTNANCTNLESTTGGKNAIEDCPAAGVDDWRFFSSDQNQMYYDPDITYVPWVYNCTSGTPCANANFNSVLSYPVSGMPGYTVTRNLNSFTYHVWIDDHGFSGTRPLRGLAVNATRGANQMVDLWDSHVVISLNGNHGTVSTTSYTPNLFGMNPTTTVRANLNGAGQCFNILGGSDLVQSIYNGTLSWTSTGADGCLTIPQAEQNIANWYQYARRRSMAARGTIAYIINQYPNFNYGMSTINGAFFIQVPPSGTTNFTTYDNTILNSLMNLQWQNYGTPSRSALDNVGQYFQNKISGTTNPITAACQQNYTVFLTDGYWKTGDSLSGGIADNDGDGISQTLADVAYYYYKNNLQPSFAANQVIPSPWDPATYLHMVTFPVSFGVVGALVAGSDGWPSPPLAINGNWGNPLTTDTAKADDMWHAAFNSKGSYVAAQSPVTAANALSAILSNIALRNASFSSAAQNSTTLNATSAVYQATVNGTQGDLEAFSISPSGVLSTTPTWSANCMLTGGACLSPVGTNTTPTPTSRVVITRNWTGANNGIAFRWPSNYSTYKVSGSLPTNMINFLANAPYSANATSGAQITANQSYGQALLDYLRGTRTQEDQNNGTYTFRDRSGLLGDIVGSSPVYVPAPYRYYPDNLEASPYSTFKSSKASRTPIVYVGANDGMLHGFNASTGSEVLAYIPGVRQIYQNLPNLSLTNYTHNFFVDGTPNEVDIYYGSAWRTILVGNLKNGGQGIYALDITNPSNFTEANASSLYLWEFTDQDDPDLGYVEGNISVAKVRTATNVTQWAIIFGNGYNNSQADGYASTTGKAALYILLPGLFSGTWTLNQNYFKIPVGTGSVTTPNGLSTPYLVDTNSDYIVDYVYAGDLKGNMWKFNLTSTTPANWQTATNILYTASFASAGDQPITAQPVVGAHPNGISYGVIVYFGTGQYLQQTDNNPTGQTTQSIYAIWDKLSGTTTVTKSQLLQQQILGEATSGSNTFRLITSNSINWNASPGPQNLGWYMDLIETTASSNFGERVIAKPTLRNNYIIVTTLLPSANSCVPGGSSWLMELDAASGGTPSASPFDVNNDGTFDTADYLTITIAGHRYNQAPAGIQSPVGMAGTPAIFLSADKKTETKVLSGSQGLGAVVENPGPGPQGRQNWRQLY